MSAQLWFTTPEGERRIVAAEFGPDRPLDRLSPLRLRRVRFGDNARRLQLRLTVVDAARPEAQQQLETEVATAVRLHRTLTDPLYRALFPEVVGYDLDGDEPFVLYAAPRGEPASALRALAADAPYALTGGLMLALTLLEQQGLVHPGVTPETVWWDGRTVQLWGLYAVQPVGRPRTDWGRPPYAAPEQLSGQGLSDPRDAVWSSAQVLYRLAAGRPGPPDRAPADLAEHRVLAELLRDAFAPVAAQRPYPGELLERLAPGGAERARGATAGDGLEPHRAAYLEALAVKRRADPAPHRRQAEPQGVEARVLCPYCLQYLVFDPKALYTANARQQFTKLDLSAAANPLTRADELRAAYQLCPGNGVGGPHHIPVPYLTHGRPITVAFVGQSATGKSHLLTQMVAEIQDGGLQPYGLSWESVNPQLHARFVREWVTPLRNGQVLQHTARLGENGQVRLVESLLVTDRHGVKRPLAFFDLAGEDLQRTDALLRFLLGIDALVFVVDPVVALPHPVLDVLRDAHVGLELNRDGDPAFDTVLDRLPRTGSYLDVPSAIVLAKADLLRFEPPVDRWLSEPRGARLSRASVRQESGDVYALLHRHAGRAWLRPFDGVRQCTLHVASATGSREIDGRYPRGVRARRVLEPLLALLGMRGLIEIPRAAGDDGYELGR